MSDALTVKLTNGLSVDSSTHKKFLNHWYIDVSVIVLSFVLIFLSYVAIKPYYSIQGVQNGVVAKIYGGLLLLGLAIYFVSQWLTKKLTFPKIVVCLMLLAFIIHLTYMLYTPYNTRQHDMNYDSDNGHYAYAITFYETWALPTKNITPDTVYQFYHPPFNAFLQGAFMHLFENVVHLDSLTSTEAVLYGSNQILSCFYMAVSVYYLVKTILLSKLSDRGQLLAIAFVALFPRLVQLSGQLNNDALSVMFSVIALYVFCKWYFLGKTFPRILLTGLFVGLSLFAKMSASIICLGMAVCFAIELVKSIRKKEGSLPVWKLVIQYVLFLLVCAPIGLWFQVYSHNVYGLPYNFVFKNLNSALFTGVRSWVVTNQGESALSYYDTNNSGLVYTSVGVNILVRYVFPFFPADFLMGGYYCNAFDNYNLLSYALRSSIFGEFDYWNADGVAVTSIILIYLAWLQFVVFLIYSLIHRLKLGKDGACALYYFFGIVALFIYLQIKMPYGCSMDFRYIVPIILPIGYLLGKENDLLDVPQATRFMRFMKNANRLTVSLFLASTTIFYFFAI
jgi:4-amino-4-deoxy-L-arabinose transferase-like glycosyltransferase